MSHTAPDPQRAATFVREHRGLLLQLARRMCRHGKTEPEDLVQETMERALQEFERLSAMSASAVRVWLSTTLTNRFLDQCRRQRTEVMGLPSLNVVQEQAAPDPGMIAEDWRAVSEEALQAAMRELKPRLREAYTLHASGMRYKEIAEKLGAPIGTVGSWISEARQDLRALLTARAGVGS